MNTFKFKTCCNSGVSHDACEISGLVICNLDKRAWLVKIEKTRAGKGWVLMAGAGAKLKTVGSTREHYTGLWRFDTNTSNAGMHMCKWTCSGSDTRTDALQLNAMHWDGIRRVMVYMRSDGYN